MKLLLISGILWFVSCFFLTSFLDKITLYKCNRKGPRHPPKAAQTTAQQTLQLDVLSIGSQTRPEYQTAQQATWANHPAIRQFVSVDERDDWEQTCASTLQESDFDAISQWCSNKQARLGPNVSWLERQWRRFTFRKKSLTAKGSDPVKWLCAQRRPMAGLIQLLRSYSTTGDGDAIPDYVAIVDDDTYLNVDMLQAHLVPSSKTQPYVGVGCQVQKTTDYDSYTAVYYVGGSGLVMSRATIQRLLKPIDCSKPPDCSADDGDHQQANICDQIENKHLIGEHLYFQNGMSLLDLMEARAKAERFTQHQNWKKGFCFHSDFYFSIWVELYPLSTQPYVEPFRRESSLIYRKNAGHSPGRATHGDCLYTTDLPCNVSKAVSCHYQAPFMMYQAHREWNATRSLVLERLQRKQQRSVSKQEQLLITPRSFTNDPKNAELVRLSSPHEHGREALSLQIQEDLMVVVGGFVGGYNGYDSASSLIQFFNTTSQHWLPRDRCLHLPDGMGQTHQGIAFDGGSRFLYVISGQVDGGCSPATTRVVRIHVDNGGEWQQLPPLPMARYDPGAVLVPNPHDAMEVHLHVFGGASAQRDQTARNHWRLVLEDGNRFAQNGLDALQWEELEPVIDSGTHGRSFQHRGIIYHTAFCDLDQQVVRGSMVKCSARDKTVQRQELHSDGGLMLAYPTQFATHNDDAVLVAGHWSRLPDMPFPGCHCSMTKIADKMVFVLGGIAAIQTKKGSPPDPLRSIQVFDLSTHTWESALPVDPRSSMPNQPSIPKKSHDLMLWADPIQQKLFGLRTNDTLFVSDFSLRNVDQKTRSSNGLAASFHHDRVQYLRMTRTRSIEAWMACLPDDHEYYVLTPMKKEYDDARLTWNFGKRDLQYPDMVAFPQSTQEVSTFIQCARRTGHHVCGRNGKHSFESDTCTYGLVIDVSHIKGAEKTDNNTIRLGAGLTLGQVVMKVEERMGRVVPMGHCASVGVTGLVLVGGQGILSRHLGMLSDYVSAVELVDAQGNVIRGTRDNEHADYLWLARGGGSGIQHYPGIITTLELSGLPKFEVQLDQPTYLTFRIDFQDTIDAAVEMMMDWQKFYTDPAHIADPLFTRLTIELWMMHESIPQRGTNPATNKTANAPTHYIQKKTVFLNVYFYGSPTLMAKFEAQYKDKIVSFVGGTGKVGREQRLSNLALHKDSAGVVGNRQLVSGQHGNDLRTTWKGFSAVSNDSVGEDVFRKIAEGIFDLSPVPSKRWMELKPLRGAVQDRIPRPDTAFWHRDALWWFLTSTSYNDEFTSDDLDEAVEAHRQHHEAVIKKMGSSFGGCYAGYIDHGRVESPGRDLPLYYGNHSQRIMDIKMQRDPENLFRLYVPNTRRNAPFTFLQPNLPSRRDRT